MPIIFIAILLIPLLLALFCWSKAGDFANQKGYAQGLASLAGLLLGPIGLWAIAMLPENRRDCPHCHEPNYVRRSTCKLCGQPLNTRPTELRV